MPIINNNTSIIKKWLDSNGMLSNLLDNYDNTTSIEDLKKQISLIIENTDTEALDSLKEVIDLINNDENGLIAILKQLDNKVDKDGEKGLSTNDFTDRYKKALTGLNYLNIYPDGIFPEATNELDTIYSEGLYHVTYSDYETYDGYCIMFVESNSDEEWIRQTIFLKNKILVRYFSYEEDDITNGTWDTWKNINYTFDGEFFVTIDEDSGEIFEEKMKVVLSGSLTHSLKKVYITRIKNNKRIEEMYISFRNFYDDLINFASFNTIDYLLGFSTEEYKLKLYMSEGRENFKEIIINSNNTPDFIDENDNTFFGDADSHLLSENSSQNILEGQDNSVGIARIPAILTINGQEISSGDTITKEDYESLDLTEIRFDDFIYATSEREDSGEFIYQILQYPIASMTTSNGNVWSSPRVMTNPQGVVTTYDEDKINYNNVVTITLGDFIGTAYDEVSTTDEYYGKPCFIISSEEVYDDFNTMMYTGPISGVDNSHVEGYQNTGLSDNIHAEGSGNVVGARAYRILSSDYTTSSYTLNNTFGLCVGDVYSIRINSNYDKWGKITAIDYNNNVVTVDTFIADILVELTDEEIEDSTILSNTFRIISKPWLGNVDWAPNAHGAGKLNRVYADNTSADGRDNTIIGRYGRASGRANLVGYAGHAQNYHNKALGTYSSASGFDTEARKSTTFTAGQNTIADSDVQFVRGKFNKIDSQGKYADIVGNGTADNFRSNAYTLDWDGNAEYSGDITSKDAKLDNLVASLEIYGNVSLSEDNKITYPVSINNINIDDNSIFNNETSIKPLYGLSQYKDILSIGNQIIQKHNIGRIKLTSSDTMDWVYSSSQSSEKYNIFYLRLETSKYSNGNVVIPNIPYSYTSDAKCFLTSNNVITELTYSPQKAKFDKAFWIEQTISASLGTSTYRIWFVSEVGQSNITSISQLKAMTFELYVPIIDSTEEIITDKFESVWTNFKNSYNKNSTLSIIGNYNDGTENSIDCEIGHSVTDAINGLNAKDTEIPDDLVVNSITANNITGPNINTIECLTVNGVDMSGTNVDYFPKCIDYNGKSYFDKHLTTYPVLKTNIYGDQMSIYRDKIRITHNIKHIKLGADVDYTAWTQSTTNSSTVLTKTFYINLHSAKRGDETVLTAEEIDLIKSGKCCFYLDDASLTGYDFSSKANNDEGIFYFLSSSNYLRLHITDSTLSDIRELGSNGKYSSTTINPQNMPEGSNDIRTKELDLYIAFDPNVKAPVTEEYEHLEYRTDWDSFITEYTIGSDIEVISDLDESVKATPVFANMEINLNKRIDDINTITIDEALSDTSINPVQNKVITAALDEKVDKVDGKGLSTNNFTNELKAKVENNTFDYVQNIPTDYKSIEDLLNDFVVDWGIEGVIKVTYCINGETHYGIQLQRFKYSDGLDVHNIFITADGEVWEYYTREDSSFQHWQKISVSQTDLNSYATKSYVNNAIGDIETSLENIIEKYGLGN